MAIQSKNPATLEVTKTYTEISDEVLEAKLELAKTAEKAWRETTYEERAKLFIKLSDYLKVNKNELSKLASSEMGKTISAGENEVDKSALTCEYYAENAAKFLADEKVETVASESYVHFDPLGILLAVMPWNFPFWQVYRFAAPALMAGNVAVLKHASNVPACAEAIEKSFIDCGFPIGVFQNLVVSSPRVEKIIRDPRIVAVALTGSEKAGADVARIAGSEIKKAVLELGGSDPLIVFKDADLNLAAELGYTSRLASNAGQTCTAAKRLIVHESICEEFIKKLTEHFSKIIVGDPMNDSTTMGPLATEQIRTEVKRQVDESVAKGAKVMYEGKVPDLPGYFYPPMILSGVTKGMPAYDEEVFGPVASIITFKDEAEAIHIANDTQYGLGATLITTDIDNAKKIAPKIMAGSVFINAQVRSDPRTPFGGIKRSGFGRELSSYGIKEFVNVKTIWVK